MHWSGKKRRNSKKRNSPGLSSCKGAKWNPTSKKGEEINHEGRKKGERLQGSAPGIGISLGRKKKTGKKKVRRGFEGNAVDNGHEGRM